MIRVNLLAVKEIKAAVGRRRELIIGSATLGVILLILLGSFFYQSYRMSKLGNELAGLQKDIETLSSKIKELGDLQNKIKEFTSKYKVIEVLNQKKTGPVKVMENLSAATPPTLWLTEYKETSGSIDIKGLAVDNQTVADFINALAKSGYFKEVELVETTQADEKTGPYKKFAIKTGVSYGVPTASGETKSDTTVSSKEGKKS